MQKNRTLSNDYFLTTSITDYLTQYAETMRNALIKVELRNAFWQLSETIKKCGRVYVAGNGGSAAIADHLCCDFEKGAKIPVQSLVNRMALFSAIANDLGYEKTFVNQLETQKLNQSDTVILISSSGNSPNVVIAAQYAKSVGAKVIGLTGFSGGKLKALADCPLHVDVNNYGVVEDCHQALMHVIAQFYHLENDDRLS